MMLENLKIVSSTGWTDLTLENDDYIVELDDHHPQSCCESHYIEWNYWEQVTPEMVFTIDTDNYDTFIERIYGYGLKFLPNPGTGYPISVPGYGSNNGYYSDEIILNIKVIDKNKNTVVHKEEIDITECQKVDWY